jgi:hypothetical protein
MNIGDVAAVAFSVCSSSGEASLLAVPSVSSRRKLNCPKLPLF